MSRRKNSIKNFISSTFGEILSIILNFINRTVFINTLGSQFLGITGLFTNILSMLALTELGLGTAITFNLYKPLAQKDISHLQSLINFYRRVYRYIGLIIGLLGMLILPFIPFIIKDDVSYINVHLIFFIYLLQTVSSYLFYAYKSTLIRVNQKEYIINIIKSYFSIITSLTQIIALVVFGDFTLYVALVVFINIIMNLVVAIKADRMFPYLKTNNERELDTTEKKEIFRNAYAVFLYKINGAVVNSTDNIVLSHFIGLNIVGIYSNYLLIYNTLQVMLSKFFTAILASLSDIHARGDTEYEYKLFRTINFFTIYIYGLAAIGVYNVINIFITLWVGEPYVLNKGFVLLLSITVYINGYQRFLDTFRTSMGLFQQAKYRPIFGIIINLGLSLILVQYMGINGVILGTIVANMLTYMWFDPYVIQHYGFKKSVKDYYLLNLAYFISIFSIGAVTHFIIFFINVTGILALILFSLITIVLVILLLHIFYRKTYEYKFLMGLIIQMLKALRVRVKKSSCKKTTIN